ncbi:MAG: iron ABC transporter substrate-binding protein [Thermoplasmatota archaeon]
MRKIAGLVVIILLLSTTFIGCIENEDNDVETLTITDMAGREVEIPKNVERIVGVGSGCVRLLVYLDVVDYIVGVEEYEKGDLMGRPYALANPELSNLPSIGPIHGGDTELIMDQEPDVIFRASSADEAEVYQDRTGIPTIDLRIGDLVENRDEFYGSLQLIGEILNKEDRVEEIIDYIDSTVQDLRDRTVDIPSEKKPEVYVGGVLYRGAHDLRSTYGNYAPFEFANAKNVAEELETDHAMVDEEQIIEWDPDIVFVDMGSYTRGTIDLDNSDYQEIKAFQNGEVYGVLPYNWHHINYGTVLASSFFVGSVIYPEQFEDIDAEEKADEIYEMLVGEPVYEYMKRDLGGFAELEP